MHIYLDNHSYRDFVRKVDILYKKFSSEHLFAFTIIYKQQIILPFLDYLRNHSINHFEISLDVKDLNNELIYIANHEQVSLVINVDKALTKRERKLLSKIKVTSRVYDTSNVDENESAYDNFYIIYKNHRCDQIYHTHLMALALLGSSPFSCANSSCLNKSVYVDGDDIYFCPFSKDSLIGSINDIDNVYNQEGFIKVIKEATAKRNECMSSCDVYPLCKGGCPLLIKETCIKEDLMRVKKEVEDFLKNNKSLSELKKFAKQQIFFQFISTKSNKK